MEKREKPDVEELTELLEVSFQERTPRFGQFNDIDTIWVYRDLIEKFPEIIPYNYFCQLWSPGITPRLLAEAILGLKKKRKPSTQWRGLSSQNKLILRISQFLDEPKKFLKKHRIPLDERDFLMFLAYAHGLREGGKSIDYWFSCTGYSNKIRESIGKVLADIYKVEILFRQELYSAYRTKGKVVRKLPETLTYYTDARRAFIPSKGKGVSRKSIDRDILEYNAYLENTDRTRSLDGRFYDTKRFRFLSNLVVRIAQLLQSKHLKPPVKERFMSTDSCLVNTFSIDTWIDNRLRSGIKNVFGVGIIIVPNVKIKATGRQDCSKST